MPHCWKSHVKAQLCVCKSQLSRLTGKLCISMCDIGLVYLFSHFFCRMPAASRGLFRWLFRGGARLEDFADRLNHVWTFVLLLVLGAVISWKHGYQSPITCWTPAHYEESLSQTDFVDQTCWASYYFFKELDKKDTTFGGYIESLPFVTQGISEELKEQATMTYYQWVPVILCLQALLFKLPHIFMFLLHGISGLDFDKVAGLTTGYHYLNLKERRTLANQVGRYIYHWCKGFPRGLPWRMLTAVWLIVKLLYCINVIIQMAYIDTFMRMSNELENNSTSFTSYGDAIYDNIAKNNGTLWKVSPMFPPQVMCDIRSDMSRLKSDFVFKYPMQCDLNANPFSERVYMFLWVWLLFVAVVTPLSCVVWVLRTFLPFHRQRLVF